MQHSLETNLRSGCKFFDRTVSPIGTNTNSNKAKRKEHKATFLISIVHRLEARNFNAAPCATLLMILSGILGEQKTKVSAARQPVMNFFNALSAPLLDVRQLVLLRSPANISFNIS
mmetsp:Transcript_16225/g.22873  ORF Transcript_16225/g.22873 Transcript_16225/m.22873 type:complete len:116 (-) Transcript_16225:1693-2040(-)